MKKVKEMKEYGGFPVNAGYLEKELPELYDFLTPEKYVQIRPGEDRILYLIDGSEYNTKEDKWGNLSPEQIEKLYAAMEKYKEKRADMIKGDPFWELDKGEGGENNEGRKREI